MNLIISEKPFGTYKEKPVTEFTLQNKNGMQLSVINYGATITRIITADKQQQFANVVNGFDTLDEYLQNSAQYICCIVGRYCNRIAAGSFKLNGETYTLARNNGNNSLHGGVQGFDKAWWKIEKQATENSLVATYYSEDGEEGFPGNLRVTVKYTLSEENELIINYTAQTDKPTVINLTSHGYFNLTGSMDVPITDHELKIMADTYTSVDDGLIPTGNITAVENSPLDFTVAKKIGKDIASINGYDHNYIINRKKYGVENQLVETAVVFEPTTGRIMEMFTTEPAVQFYSGNLNPVNGQQYGFCLEAQHYPDSPNKPSFPNTILQPNEIYHQTTIYKFSTKL